MLVVTLQEIESFSAAGVSFGGFEVAAKNYVIFDDFFAIENTLLFSPAHL
jgi:hypothetical protein